MPGAASGLFDNVRGLAASGVRAVRTRLELLGIELQEEKARAVRQLLVGAAVAYLLSFGSLLGVFWIVMTLPQGDRAMVLGALALGFLAAGGLALLWLLARGPRRRPLLATTVAVLKRDEDALASVAP
jgi:uncharacterized membrane protein YqjE